MDLHLHGKVALVTAGSKGIGQAIATQLAREGASVTISARGKTSLDATRSSLESLGASALALESDMTVGPDIKRLVSDTIQHFGRLDVLIVNAGGPPPGSFPDFEDESWESAFRLTFLSAVRVIRAALPHLKQTGGSVVTVSSISVKQPVHNLILSNAIRPAVVGLTKTLADELGPSGIRINNILTGMILTDRAYQLAEARAASASRPLAEILHDTEQSIPLRRYGRPEEIGRLATFLASDASSFITGTSILCDGGQYRGLL